MPNSTLVVESDDGDDYALFVKDGSPVKFCFHQSVTQGKGQIRRDVERYGGQMVSDERQANVVLVDEEQDIELIRRMYYSSTEVYRLSVYVEPRGFVQDCLHVGEYRHIAPRKKGMPGRAQTEIRPGRTRIAFTEEDRDHLAYYLATLFPTRDGRMGNKAYKDLVQLGETDDPSWEWARRHTWSSWREHYKTRPDAMDVRIDRFLRALKDTGHHLGQDPRAHGGRDVRQVQMEEEDEENDEEEVERQRQKQKQRAERPGHRKPRQQADRPVAATSRQSAGMAHKKVRDDSDESMREEGEEEESVHRVKHCRVQSDTNQQHELPDSPARRARLPAPSSSQGRVPRVEPEERQRAERAQADCSTTAVREPPPKTTRKKDVLVCDGNEENGQDEEQSQPVKRNYGQSDANRQHESPISPAKRPRVSEVFPSSQIRASGVGADHDSKSDDDNAIEESQSLEIKGSDLFGDREYGSQPESDDNTDRGRESQPNFDNDQGFDSPMEFSPKGPTRPVREQDALPRSTPPLDVEEEYDEGAVKQLSELNSLTTQDEMSVEELLETDMSQQNEEDEDSDEDIMSGLPRFQEVEIEDEPSDSDDVETHEILVRGSIRQELGAGEGESGSSQHQDDDAARIEEMANGTLLNRAAAVQPMIAALQKFSPRTRSASQASKAPPMFPSPGTRARAVADRFREDERKVPYTPPVGSRAAKVVKGKAKQR